MSFMNASDIRESAAKWKGLLIVLYRPTSNVSSCEESQVTRQAQDL